MARKLILLAIAACAAAPAGCSRWATRGGNRALSAEPISSNDAIRVVNENAARVQSLYVPDMSISVHQSGQLVPPLDARMALEKPRNFRLIASLIGGTEADLGSNSDEFWCYVRRGEQGPQLIHCSYDDYGRTGQALPIQPDWIIEAIGLTPVPEDSIVQPGKPGLVEIVTPSRTPQGDPASKITVVQLRSGYVVEKRLEVGRQPVAFARLSKHRRDSAFGAVVPGEIKIEWPAAGLRLEMDLNKVQVNPPFDPAWKQTLWQIPSELQNNKAISDVDLGAAARPPAPRRGAPTGRRPAPEYLN